MHKADRAFNLISTAATDANSFLIEKSRRSGSNIYFGMKTKNHCKCQCMSNFNENWALKIIINHFFFFAWWKSSGYNILFVSCCCKLIVEHQSQKLQTNLQRQWELFERIENMRSGQQNRICPHPPFNIWLTKKCNHWLYWNIREGDGSSERLLLQCISKSF